MVGRLIVASFDIEARTLDIWVAVTAPAKKCAVVARQVDVDRHRTQSQSPPVHLEALSSLSNNRNEIKEKHYWHILHAIECVLWWWCGGEHSHAFVHIDRMKACRSYPTQTHTHTATTAPYMHTNRNVFNPFK